MDIAVYSSIDLYAQLAFLAKLRTKRCRPSFSAGAVLNQNSGVSHNHSNLIVNLHRDEKTCYILRFLGSDDGPNCAGAERRARPFGT